MKKTGFNWKMFIRSIAVIAIPVALQNLLTTTASMVDTFMISSLGELTVGAVGLAGQFTSLMFSCYFGFCGGGMLFLSQYWGAHDEDGINRSYGMVFVCMMTVGVIFGVLCTAFPEFVMKVYTDKPRIQKIGVRYLKIIGFWCPLNVLASCASLLLRATERVKIPLYASIASVLTNILFNWLLIYGNLGFPKLGVEGAAIATVISGLVDVLVLFIAAKGAKFKYLFEFRRHFIWDSEHTKAFFRKCFPIICNELLLGVATMLQNVVLGRQAEEAIAALAIFRTIEGLFIGFFGGFTNAASILVGKAIGSGELETGYQRAKRLVYLNGTFIALISIIVACLTVPILKLMGLSGESLRIGRGMIYIFCFVVIIRMCNWIQNDTYRAAGDPIYGTVLEISFMFLLVLPILFLNGFVFKTPFLLLFALLYVDEPIRFVLMQIHMFRGKWVLPVTEEGIRALPAFRKNHHIVLKEKQIKEY